jgi:hypothetical protein
MTVSGTAPPLPADGAYRLLVATPTPSLWLGPLLSLRVDGSWEAKTTIGEPDSSGGTITLLLVRADAAVDTQWREHARMQPKSPISARLPAGATVLHSVNVTRKPRSSNCPTASPSPSR